MAISIGVGRRVESNDYSLPKVLTVKKVVNE